MAGDQYEPNRVLGIPVGAPSHARQGEEPQRVMGIPVSSIGSADLGWLRAVAHPARAYRRWLRRRRLGPYAADESEPGRKG